jgi:hypothetical protein
MIKDIPSVDFNPQDDLILDLPNDSGKHVYHTVMASGDEKRFLESDYVNMGKPTTIYFDINDAKVFKKKVGQSMKEQKGEGFNPKIRFLILVNVVLTISLWDFHNTNKREAGILC